jgi:hypothetical protein
MLKWTEIGCSIHTYVCERDAGPGPAVGDGVGFDVLLKFVSDLKFASQWNPVYKWEGRRLRNGIIYVSGSKNV